MARHLALALLAFALAAVVRADDPECVGSTGLVSEGEEGEFFATFHNDAHYAMNVYWVDSSGENHMINRLLPKNKMESNTYVGHVFRAAKTSGEIVREWRITKETHEVRLEPCGEDPGEYMAEDRSAEFKSLVHDQAAPCVGEDSSKWSCIRTTSREDVRKRDITQYGFHEGEGPLRQNFDESYAEHIARMPKITAKGPGFLKMDMPAAMKAHLDNFYAEKRDTAQVHDHIPGGYTNNDLYPFDHINLDYNRDTHQHVIDHMHPIMEWWTNMTLEHTSTFGVRIYKRHSMLINHVDREDTHLASAVIQVAQTVDANGGWPLEVYLPDGAVGEVFLQPGEMVLYEGAWLRHGRPMRFRGTEFANIFSHFKPLPWSGTHAADRPSFYGFKKGRCSTIADEGGSGCSESIKAVGHHSEL